MRRTLAALACSLALYAPAVAIVGDAPPAEWTMVRPTVMVRSQRGACSGIVVAQNLVLTAAHCVTAVADYFIVGYIAGLTGARPFRLAEVATIVLHPQYSPATGARADIALLKLTKPLPTDFVSVFLTPHYVRAGDRVIVVGYGLGKQNDHQSVGIPRMAMLVVTHSNANQFTLKDQNGDKISGCGGDSGAPVFAARRVYALVGVVSGGGCGTETLATAFAGHRTWLIETARTLSSPVD